MSALTMGFWQRHDPAMGRSFVLSALVHIVLVAILVLGVRWQVRAPDVVEVELVATAIGLFAAIPAVVAYNRYSHDIERLANRFESFMEEFSNILHRQAVK